MTDIQKLSSSLEDSRSQPPPEGLLVSLRPLEVSSGLDQVLQGLVLWLAHPGILQDDDNLEKLEANSDGGKSVLQMTYVLV